MICRILTRSIQRDNCSEDENTEVQVGRVGEKELEVATITYLRVSGLEGLGSPIISEEGSG